MTRGVEQQEVTAELASIESLLREVPGSRVLERRGLEGRARRLRKRLEELRATRGRNAEVALFFSGSPVAGVHGISADFAGPAIDQFTKLVAAKESALIAPLGAIVSSTKGEPLHITGTVHGSFGFQLEELSRPLLGDTDTFAAVHETMQLLARLEKPISSETEDALTSESRAFYEALKGFLRTLHDRGAVVRIVGDDEEVRLNSRAIEAAMNVLLATNVDEQIVVRQGVFGGSLDFSGKFEFRDAETGRVITGKVAKEATASALDAFLHEPCRARMRVLTSIRGQQTRTTYTLLGLEAIEPAKPPK